MMIVQVCDLEFGDFIYMLGDVYLYLNYFEQVELQFSCELFECLIMEINLEVKDIFGFIFDDFMFKNY